MDCAGAIQLTDNIGMIFRADSDNKKFVYIVSIGDSRIIN